MSTDGKSGIRAASWWIHRLKKQKLQECLIKLGVDPSEWADKPVKVLRTILRQTVRELALSETEADSLLRDETAVIDEANEESDEKSETDETKDEVEPEIETGDETEMAAALNAFPEFQAEEDNLEDYLERFELCLCVAALKDDKQKVAALLTKLGRDKYIALKAACDEDKRPGDWNYAELKAQLNAQEEASINVNSERSKFRKIHQKPGQTVKEFSMLIRHAAAKCKFKARDEACQDQFINGLADEGFKFEVHKQNPTTFAEAITAATVVEAAFESATGKNKKTTEAPTESLSLLQLHNQPSTSKAEDEQRNFKMNVSQSRRYDSTGVTRYKQQQQGSRPPRRTAENQQSNDGNKCYCCGYSGHYARNCKYNTYQCTKCGKQGHLRQVCRNSSVQARPQRKQNFVAGGDEAESEEDDMYESNRERELSTSTSLYKHSYVTHNELRAEHMSKEQQIFSNIFNVIPAEANKSSENTVNITIEGKIIDMEVDTGAFYTLMTIADKQRWFPTFEMSRPQSTMKFYDGTLCHPVGVLKNMQVEFEGDKKLLDIYIVQRGYGPLFGEQWLRAFSRWPPVYAKRTNKNCNNVKTKTMVVPREQKQQFENIMKTRARVFDANLGCFNAGQLTLRVKNGSKPIFKKARPLAYALKDKVKDEIEKLQKGGILIPISFSDWATPIVPIIKPDGGVRLCGDFKVTVNLVLEIDRYPIPRVEDLMTNLQGGVKFTKLDLSQAYAQIPLTQESRKYVTINTHMGLFQYTRLPYGVSTGPGSFQRIIEQILAGISGVGIFLDDIVITASSANKHLRRLDEVLARLEKVGPTVNRPKCEFFQDEVVYLGFRINKEGLHVTEDKVKAVRDAPRPTTITEMRAFLGLVNFYAQFIPDSATRMGPLYNQLKKKKIKKRLSGITIAKKLSKIQNLHS